MQIKKVNNVGDLIKNYRHIIGLTQQQFADKVKIKKPCISLYESGKRKPEKEQIEKLVSNSDLKYEVLFIATLLDTEQIELKDLKAQIKCFEKYFKNFKK